MEIKNNTKRKTDIYTLVSSNSIKAVSQMKKYILRRDLSPKSLGLFCKDSPLVTKQAFRITSQKMSSSSQPHMEHLTDRQPV